MDNLQVWGFDFLPCAVWHNGTGVKVELPEQQLGALQIIPIAHPPHPRDKAAPGIMGFGLTALSIKIFFLITSFQILHCSTQRSPPK